jgi:hypothetical protein
MMTTIGLSTEIRSTRQARDNYWINAILLCMWSVVGLALTGLSFALGFGAQVGQALAAAG